MPRGRQTRTLRPDQIARLEKFRRSAHDGAQHGYSLPQLRLAMGASFGWRTLQTALKGLPVWDLSYFYIVQWIERFIPEDAPPQDGKSAAAGEKLEEGDAEEAPGTTRTLRGSR